MALQGLMTFPGVSQIVSGSFTYSHGISPSAAILDIAPQSGLVAQQGTLSITFGTVSIEFPDSIIDSGSLRLTESGHVLGFRILDRRWKWQYGEINGWYNRRLANGNLDPARARNPRQLGVLCLAAMGETGAVADGLPTTGNPEVNWVAANPANELAALCDQFNCKIWIRSDNTVEVFQNNVGALLPGGTDPMNANFGIDPPEIPDSIKVVCGAVAVQSRLKLEAVGKDVDGTVKPIANLSYRPPGGWNSPVGFWDVPNTDERELARQTVFRWYRIVSQSDGTNIVPGLNVVAALWQLLPISDVLLDTQPDGTPKPAEVYGIFFDDSLVPERNRQVITKVDSDFRVNGQEGIVEFSETVWLLLGAGTPNQQFIPAEIDIETSYNVLDATTRQFIRYDQTLNTGGNLGTEPLVIRDDGITQTFRAVYLPNGAIQTVTNNTASITPQATAVAQAAQDAYNITDAVEVQYAGIKDITRDGALAQLSWAVGPQGATTRAGRNTEVDYSVPRYSRRRSREEAIQEKRQRRGRGNRQQEVDSVLGRRKGA